MNRAVLSVPVLVFSAVVLAACAPAQQDVQTPNETESSSQQGVQGEMADVFAAMQAGRGVTCTITDAETGAVTNYKAKDKKAFGDSTVTIEGKQQQGYFLTDAEYMYTWSGDTKQGAKFKLDAFDPESANAPDVPDFSDEESYQEYQESGHTVACSIEDHPDSVFVPPTDVSFFDMSSFTQPSVPQPSM